MRREQPDYLSYLVRLWRTGDQHPFGRRVWRASLESPHTGERWSFASLEELFDFLERQTGQPDKIETIEALTYGFE